MAKIDKTNQLDQKLRDSADAVGNFLVDGFHYLALFAIGGAIVWSAAVAFFDMALKGGASIHDILLLFIYLEMGAMVGIYFKTQHMPTRFLIYIGITALVRLLIDDILGGHDATLNIVYVSGSILLLALANLVVRYGSTRFPSDSAKELLGAVVGAFSPKANARTGRVVRHVASTGVLRVRLKPDPRNGRWFQGARGLEVGAFRRRRVSA
ncbi:MAG: phosphate-starvation-inducible PsiE family protein [Halofilum sp. (in: g-proteobacteria)]|nr:phosphate-starvation-inducible PsiE family protein [Halofilum sp. (in: g-proteobacteria)]